MYSYTTPFRTLEGTLAEALAYAAMAWDASGYRTVITAPDMHVVAFVFNMSNKAVLV